MQGTNPFRLIIIIVVSVCLSLIFRDYGMERIYVASASMEPLMEVQSRWWMDKFTLRVRSPRRGEVIVFESPVDFEKDLIKRVIAIEGDTLEVRNKQIIRNNEPLDEPYALYTRANELLVGDNLGPLTVPEDHLFVVGDNRDHSGDSRDWKDLSTGERVHFVPMANVRGRILGVK